MTCRPSAIYLVAFWWWIAFSVAVMKSIPRLTPPTGATDTRVAVTANQIAAILSLVAVVLAVWGVVGIIQLRGRALWILRTFLVFWTLIILSRLNVLLSGAGAALAFAAGAIAINIAVVWYVSRPQFQAMCAQFRKEKNAEAMRRIGDKAMRALHK